MLIVFAAFIVEDDYLNRNLLTTRGTGMQNVFLCEYLLKKRGVEYVQNACRKHLDLKWPQIKNLTQSAAAIQIRFMLFVEPKQRLEEMMLFDPHVKFAKSIGVKDIKICHAFVMFKQLRHNVHCLI